MNEELLKLPFDIYSRYKIIADFILQNREQKSKLKILDVGGGFEDFLKMFLPQEDIRVVDVYDCQKDDYVKGDALNLPFSDNEFDFVFSCDVFEHIKNYDRTRFVLEQLRVSKNFVVLAAPFFSEAVVMAEKNANDFFKTITGNDYIWLKEHLENGLPSEELFDEFLARKQLNYKKLSHCFLGFWSHLIKVNIVKDFFPKFTQEVNKLNIFYNKNVGDVDFSDFSYRKFYFISKSNNRIIFNKKTESGSSFLQMFPELLFNDLENKFIGEKLLSFQIIDDRELISRSLNELINSTSWKITAPLRWLIDKIKNYK